MDPALDGNKMENSAALNIFFKHIFSRVGRNEKALKATWPSANIRDVFQSHRMTWYDTGKYLVQLTGLYCSRCRGWVASMRDKRLYTCKPNRNWRFTVIYQHPVPAEWDVPWSVFGTGQN